MNEDIRDRLNKIETTAQAMMGVPANEQNIGVIQASIFVAIMEIHRCLEAIAKERNED